MERPLIDAALVVLERVQVSWLSDAGVRYATLATIGTLAWKSRFFPDIEPRLDRIHAEVFKHPSAYSRELDDSAYVANPALVGHVAEMIARGTMVPQSTMAPLERFADWLAAWSPERKEKLRPALTLLNESCPLLDWWSRVGLRDLGPPGPLWRK